MIYPSNEFGARRGVIVGAYAAGWTNRDNPERYAGLSHAERAAISRASIEALHPGRSRLLSKPVSVAWGLTPFSEGVGPMWRDDGVRGPGYAELLKPEGPIVFAGEHLSYQPTWQEGAALSALDALELVAALSKAKVA